MIYHAIEDTVILILDTIYILNYIILLNYCIVINISISHLLVIIIVDRMIISIKHLVVMISRGISC